MRSTSTRSALRKSRDIKECACAGAAAGAVVKKRRMPRAVIEQLILKDLLAFLAQQLIVWHITSA
jgi:hypothetical protein